MPASCNAVPAPDPALDHSAACRHLCRCDPRMKELIDRVGACSLQLDLAHSVFDSLFEAIVYQQLTGKAAKTILERVKALFGNGQTVSGRHGDGLAFPTPEHVLKTSDERLRSAGLSRAKTAALKDLAAKTLDGTVPTLKRAQKMTDEELIEHLTQVRGIGRWTVEMFLIFRLGRYDVLPVTDYGVRKGYKRLFKCRELPNASQMFKRGERWRPYRSIASWYLWRAAEF